jgi:hypothetical protein
MILVSTRPLRQWRMSPRRSRTSLRPALVTNSLRYRLDRHRCTRGGAARRTDLDHLVGHGVDLDWRVAGLQHVEAIRILALEPTGEPFQSSGLEPLLGLVEDEQPPGPNEGTGERQPALLPGGEVPGSCPD